MGRRDRFDRLLKKAGREPRLSFGLPDKVSETVYRHGSGGL
jgi:hypothetical protein